MTSNAIQALAGGRVLLLTGMFGEPEREILLDRVMAIGEVITAHALAFRLPTIAVLNGEPVLRGEWAVRQVRASDTIAFVAVPGGPGGGGGGANNGKQIMGLVAALALSVAAPFVGSFIAGSLGLAAGTLGFSIASSLASAAFLAGGALLLNALMPPPETQSQSSLDAAGRVYSVNATSNQTTPLEPLPVLYGRLRFPPRHASRPYSEYQGNDQYLYQLFMVTAGKADITKVEIGETEAWNAVDGYSASFSDLEFEIVQPGEDITLFPANVVTSVEVSGLSVPNPPAELGPFVVNSAGTTVDRLAVDFAFPSGLFTVDSSRIAANSISLRAQYRQIDNGGSPIGSWQDLFNETVSASTRTPQRMSRSLGVTPGRYEVKFLANEAFDPDDGAAVNAVVWTGLRGYLTDFMTPPNCTLLAMKIRANEQLSQFASNQIRVTAERYLPVWDDELEDWVEQKTRSISWAATDQLMNSDYSIGLSSLQFDMEALIALEETFEARGDHFDAIFDRSWSVQDALRATLRVGRTQAVRMGGRIGFVRLEPKLIRRAVFTPRNVIRGSFQHKLILNDEEKPDSVLGSYIDATTWREQEVLGSLASVGSDLPQKVDWFGITDHDHAWRESVTEAAVNAYCREFVSFTAEWDGKLLVRGEPILVQHPFIDMEAVQLAAVTGRSGLSLAIDRDLEHEIAGDAYAIIRAKDGREWGPCLIDMIGEREVTLEADDAAVVSGAMGSLADILPADRSVPAHILICDGESRPFNGLVVAASPNSSGKVDIVAVVDAPEVYLADGAEVMPSPWTPPVLPPQNPARPLVLGLFAELRAGTAQMELDAMWEPSRGVLGGYVAEISYDSDDLPESEKTWTPVYAGSANRFTVVVLPQPLVLRVAAMGVLQGAWSKRIFTIGDVPTLVFPGVENIQVSQLGQELQNAHGLVTGTDATDIPARLAQLTAYAQELALAVMDFNATTKETLNILSAQNAAGSAAVIRNEKAIVAEGFARAEALTEVLAQVDNVIAGGFLKFEAEVNELASVAVITAKVRATSGSFFSEAAWMLRAEADGLGGTVQQFGVLGDFYVFESVDGPAIPAFGVSGGEAIMRAAKIDVIRSGRLESADGKFIINLDAKRISISSS